MSFWGVEVKSGETHEVEFEDARPLHLSKASLGKVKNRGNESVFLFAQVNGEKIVLATLVPDRCTDVSFDLVFEKELKLSHNWKNGSVYFTGYKKGYPRQEPRDAGKAGPLAAKAKVDIVGPKKDDKAKVDDSSEDGSGEDESDDKDVVDGSDHEDEEATPKKAEKSSKDRPSESATTRTPAEEAELITPEKEIGAVGITPFYRKECRPQKPLNRYTCGTCGRTYNIPGKLIEGSHKCKVMPRKNKM